MRVSTRTPDRPKTRTPRRLAVSVMTLSPRDNRPKAFLFTFALACALGSGGCSSTQFRASELPPQLAAQPSVSSRNIQLQSLASAGGNTALIAPGDLLEVHVVSGAEEAPPEPHLARVDDGGAVEAPVIGPVRVAGLEPAAAGRAIARAAIERRVYKRPNVTVAVREQATNKVMVLGAVAEPGLHSLPKGASDVLSAIAAAGGLTEEAGMEVEVLRQAPPAGAPALASAPIDNPTGGPGGVEQAGYTPRVAAGPVKERINLADASAQRAARDVGDRDVVMVLPKEQRVIHVTGLVNRPDQFELPDEQPIRVLDAIAMAGGSSSPVADKVIVIRQREDAAAPAAIGVSIAKAKRNGRENLVLAPGDLVSVETTVATTVVDAVQDFFRITMGVSSNLTAF